MHFEERIVGDYRIYAGAMEAKGGYVAAVVVKRFRGAPGCPEVYRDESMSGGHRWARPEEALKFAIAKAREAIVEHQLRLARQQPLPQEPSPQASVPLLQALSSPRVLASC